MQDDDALGMFVVIDGSVSVHRKPPKHPPQQHQRNTDADASISSPTPHDGGLELASQLSIHEQGFVQYVPRAKLPCTLDFTPSLPFDTACRYFLNALRDWTSSSSGVREKVLAGATATGCCAQPHAAGLTLTVTRDSDAHNRRRPLAAAESPHALDRKTGADCIFNRKICFRDAVPLVSRDSHLQGIMLEGLDAILNAVIAGKEASGCVIFGTK